jgi:hypothetical protein
MLPYGKNPCCFPKYSFNNPGISLSMASSTRMMTQHCPAKVGSAGGIECRVSSMGITETAFIQVWHSCSVVPGPETNFPFPYGVPFLDKLLSPGSRPHTAKIRCGHTGKESKMRAPHRVLNYSAVRGHR